MPTEPLQPGQKRCPICWTPFTPNPASNPNPRRYCSSACRNQDWRRRRSREHVQTLLDTALQRIRAANAADAERRHALARHNARKGDHEAEVPLPWPRPEWGISMSDSGEVRRAPSLYGSEEEGKLRFVRQAKGLGLSLGDIRVLIAAAERGCCGEVVPELDRLLEQRIDELDARLRTLVAFRDRLVAFRAGHGSRCGCDGHGAFCGCLNAAPTARPTSTRRRKDIFHG